MLIMSPRGGPCQIPAFMGHSNAQSPITCVNGASFGGLDISLDSFAFHQMRPKSQNVGSVENATLAICLTEHESDIGFHSVIILNGEPNYPIAQISVLIEAIGIQRIDNPITYYLREIRNS
jgi:hypothetical protein